jgi:hypothetical protein
MGDWARMGRGSRNIGKNLLAIFIGISISFVLLEGLLRIFQPIEYRVKGNKVKLPRDKKYQLINNNTDKLDKIIPVTRNHLGLRGEMPPKNFAEALTVIAIGGSTTECSFISDGKTWCDILSNKLKQNFMPLWLNNAGLDGNTTFGHIILMEDYIVKIRPKVALFLLGANEIALQAPGDYDRKQLKNPVSGLVASCWEGMINNSEVLSYAINFHRYSKANKVGLLTHLIFNFPEMEQIDFFPETIQAARREHREKYLKPYAQRLKRLIQLCRENSIEPVFITQPAVVGDLLDPVTGANLARISAWGWNGKVLWEILGLYNEVLRTSAREHQVYVIDLAGEMPKTTEYYYDTYHFSNEGCQQVAKIIAKYLEPFLAEKFPQYLVSNYPGNH